MSSVLGSSARKREWRTIAIVLAAVFTVLGIAYYWFLSGTYAVLVTGARPEEAAAIVEALKKQEIAFKLEKDGTTILVPAAEVDAARLDIAGQDLPLKGTTGFELFNKSDMGLTDFAQKVNYQRALQGEIARTIMAMEGIASARVHLAIPERSLFRNQRAEPRAAVTLIPGRGATIDADRIAGIKRLVAATVPELALDQVAILNEKGQLLTPEFSDLPGIERSQSALESNYRDRVLRAIAATAPREHVETKVTVVTGSPVDSRVPSSGPSETRRDHAIRIVVFERTPLAASVRETMRQTIERELELNPSLGDQLLFSPAPVMSVPVPSQALAVEASAGPEKFTAQNQLMEQLERGWLIAFLILGGAAALFGLHHFRRRRQLRRTNYLQRIRSDLLFGGSAADAA